MATAWRQISAGANFQVAHGFFLVDCDWFGRHAIEAAVAPGRAGRTVYGADGNALGTERCGKALAEAPIGKQARDQILARDAVAMMYRAVTAAQPARAAVSPLDGVAALPCTAQPHRSAQCP